MATVAGSQRLLNISGNNVTTAVSLEAGGTLIDTSGDAGTSGQVLSSTATGVNWVTANPGDITGVTASSPLTGGGTSGTVTVGIQTASASQAGALSAANWTTFNNKTSNTGTVTSVGTTGTVSGLTLTGTVTTSGNLTLGGTLSLTSANVTTGLGFTPYNATNPAGYTANTGTVTSVAATHGGNAFTVSIGNDAAVNPSVDIAVGGTSAQYINGAGNLTTFPTIPQGDITGVTAGTNLTGGGTSGNVTLNVIGGDGITANANDIAVDGTVVRTTGTQSIGGTKTFTGNVKLTTQNPTGDNIGKKCFIGISSSAGAQKFKIVTNTSTADGYARFKIDRAYDYGNNDQMVQEAIYQRRGTVKNFVFKYDGDIATADDVYLEVYELSNGHVDIWCCVDDYAQSTIEVTTGSTESVITSPTAGTPTGTLIHSSNPDTETPNWNSHQGEITATTFLGSLNGTINTATTGATQTAGDNSTKIATTAYVEAAVSGVGDITSVTAGTGMTGGGTSGAVTLNVIGGTGITANADDIAIDATVATLAGTQTFTNKSGSNDQWTNDAGYTANTGTTTADNTQTFTNKSGSNSQWTNDEGYTANTGTTTASNTQTFTNKSGSNDQWTNDAGYTTNTGTVTGAGAAGRVSFWDSTSSLDDASTLYWDSTNNHLGINDSSPGSALKVFSGTAETSLYTIDVNHVRNNANVATAAMRLNVDLSGADTTTADRTNSGLYVDMDSSANGDAANEHRMYGVHSDVRYTGFSDVVRGGYFYAESNYTGAKTSSLAGVHGIATHDTNNVAGGVSNMYGGLFSSNPQDIGDVDNATGVMGAVAIGTARGNADIGNTNGVIGKITIDKAVDINYSTMIGVSSIIDNNEGTVPTFGNQYLFKGDYQGEKGSLAWGIYVEGDKNYLEGNLGINTTVATQKLHVNGNARVTGAYYDANNSPGTAGQILSSTATGTDWIDAAAGDITGVTAGTGMTGGGTSGAVTLNVIGGTGITANADDIAIDSTVATLTGTQTFTNKSGSNSQWTNDEGYTDLVVGTAATDAMAGDTTTITSTQATAITDNTAKVTDTGVPAVLSDGSAPSLNTNISQGEMRTLIGAGTSSLVIGTTAARAMAGDTTTISTTQASDITTNNGKVSDTGVPAILSDGTTPTLNTGISGAEVRTLIGAAASGSSGTVTQVSASIDGDALDVTVTDDTTTPDVAFTFNGDATQYIRGNGVLNDFPVVPAVYTPDVYQLSNSQTIPNSTTKYRANFEGTKLISGTTNTEKVSGVNNQIKVFAAGTYEISFDACLQTTYSIRQVILGYVEINDGIAQGSGMSNYLRTTGNNQGGVSSVSNTFYCVLAANDILRFSFQQIGPATFTGMQNITIKDAISGLASAFSIRRIA